MADLSLYVKKIPQIEGTKYEFDVDRYRKFGIGTDDIERATGQKISETDLKNMEWGNPLIEKAIGWYWHGVMANYYPQSIAETITDHVFNKGMSGICGIQSMLRTRYKANIATDGKIGPQTAGAILAAVNKYGEKHVYNSIYAYRLAYYSGGSLPQHACKNSSCTRAICKTLINTRLNRYYPIVGNENPESLLLPVSDAGLSMIDVVKYATQSSIKETFNSNSQNQKKYILIMFGITAIIIGSLVIAIKTVWK